ncbi:hypothetical protein LG634_00420 [Streptomyces bambusae]|uniref:hypothetical protein n=1 Tax=Streptomyces bambusae TaxID=1550616 RepID=UPI001CFE5B25|nr:hypothetical protein [Streptomyces bambusae]MCB5163321.1 hypothetical protein [Streptomyces bambusae]
MTSTTGAIRHPDVSEISDLTEGLLSPARTAEVRGHLTDCALCADVRDSLEEIRGLLGTLPGHPRMPADIAGRIDAALAAEALLDATSPEARPVSADDETTPVAEAPAPDVSRETPRPVPAADVRSTGPDRPAGRGRAATGPGLRSRRRIALGALTGAAVLAFGVFLTQNMQTSSTDAKKDAGTFSASLPSGEFTAAELGGTVQQLLNGESTDSGAKTYPVPNSLGADTKEAGTKGAAPPLPACVRAGTGRTEPPLAAEQGTYQGTDVYLVVLPHPGDSRAADAYLVDAGCETAAPQGKGQVLFENTYPRP